MKVLRKGEFFFAVGDPEKARDAGFRPYQLPNGKWVWHTWYALVAYNLREYADPELAESFGDIEDEIHNSRRLWSPGSIPAREGKQYYDFQIPAIEYAIRYPRCLIADDMGLGKTIEAVGVANALGLQRILIVCPASLRDNWAREFHEWKVGESALSVLKDGKQMINPAISAVMSYELVSVYFDAIMATPWDMLIVDEAHRIKNPNAKRTQLILGTRNERGLVDHIERTILLTGSPIRNWPDEMYGILRKMAPAVIDRMSGGAYMRRFCVFEDGDFGVKVVDTRNEAELYDRLRSGFMVRRTKKEALPYLPELQYKLVVLPQDGDTARVIDKEREFDAQEIYKSGIPVGSPFPEIRHDLAKAKVATTCDYVRGLLEDGAEKVLVFGHHVEPMREIHHWLQEYNPALLIGATKEKQKEVDRFQSDPTCRVFVGNDAAFEGYNLTAGTEVVFHESSFVPEDNAQAVARAFRLGQSCKVTAHILVIEASIEAYILGRAAKKLSGIKNVIDGEKL